MHLLVMAIILAGASALGPDLIDLPLPGPYDVLPGPLPPSPPPPPSVDSYVECLYEFDNAVAEVQKQATFDVVVVPPFTDPRRHYLALISVIGGLVQGYSNSLSLQDFQSSYVSTVENYLILGYTQPKIVITQMQELLTSCNQRIQRVRMLIRSLCVSSVRYSDGGRCNAIVDSIIQSYPSERYDQQIGLLQDLSKLAKLYQQLSHELKQISMEYMEMPYLLKTTVNIKIRVLVVQASVVLRILITWNDYVPLPANPPSPPTPPPSPNKDKVPPIITKCVFQKICHPVFVEVDPPLNPLPWNNLPFPPSPTPVPSPPLPPWNNVPDVPRPVPSLPFVPPPFMPGMDSKIPSLDNLKGLYPSRFDINVDHVYRPSLNVDIRRIPWTSTDWDQPNNDIRYANPLWIMDSK